VKENESKTINAYLRFFLMIRVAMLIMYFLTYLNSFEILEHAWFSETRLYMTLLMGSVMMGVMLGFIWKNYPRKSINIAILLFSVVMFSASLWLVRSQRTVTGVGYMEAMIPHHSIAILTSTRVQITDPRVKHLADEIIRAQRREIKEMEGLIEDIRNNGLAETEADAEERPVPDFEGELNPSISDLPEPTGAACFPPQLYQGAFAVV
jgi:hypothetical protein